MQTASKIWMPTYTLIAANVVVYALTAFLSRDAITTSDRVILAFGQDNFAVSSGEVWRLFTAMFVHADITHLFGNMFFLLIFGLRAEDMFKAEEYYFIYLLSGLTGGLLTFFFWYNTLSVGASGAIFGILGATIIYARRSIGQSIISALIYAFFLFMLNIGANVNILAHFGGLVTGLLIGYALAASRKPGRPVSYRHAYSYAI